MAVLETKRAWLRVLPFFLFFLGAALAGPLLGSVRLDLGEALSHLADPQDSVHAAILLHTRLPRSLLAALTGAALAVAGAVFQALLRNPLATPYTLVVSSWGSLGAVLAILLGLDALLPGFPATTLCALLGAGGTVALVWALARARGHLPTPILMLAGVSVSFFFAAMILLAHYLADFGESYRMIRWLMGGLDVVGFGPILRLLPFWCLGMGAMFLMAGDLDLLSFGDYLAHARGVRVSAARTRAYLAASLSVAAVVSVAGPIGFVGLIVPHSVRFLIGPGHRTLLPASAFAGAGFLILCDLVARTWIAPTEIPVGILTALLGGPFFIGLLFREKRRYVYGE